MIKHEQNANILLCRTDVFLLLLELEKTLNISVIRGFSLLAYHAGLS